MYKCE